MSIGYNISFLKAKLPANVKLVAVSKFHSAEDIMEAFEAGQRVFGESRVQELQVKKNILPTDIEWHFIGNLQNNKVKDIAAYIHTIHSVDSLKLLYEINKQAAKHSRIINVLLEIHIAKEENKHGFSPSECMEMLEKENIGILENIRICGLMGMATFTEDKKILREEFAQLHSLWKELKFMFFQNSVFFNELSMGMTNDYDIALEEGSTMVRIGSLIFGIRT